MDACGQTVARLKASLVETSTISKTTEGSHNRDKRIASLLARPEWPAIRTSMNGKRIQMTTSSR
jgi:hypothetical protein